jgi:hypothetical protein
MVVVGAGTCLTGGEVAGGAVAGAIGGAVAGGVIGWLAAIGERGGDAAIGATVVGVTGGGGVGAEVVGGLVVGAVGADDCPAAWADILAVVLADDDWVTTNAIAPIAIATTIAAPARRFGELRSPFLVLTVFSVLFGSIVFLRDRRLVRDYGRTRSRDLPARLLAATRRDGRHG